MSSLLGPSMPPSSTLSAAVSNAVASSQGCRCLGATALSHLLDLAPADEPPVLVHAAGERDLLALLGADRAGQLQLGQIVLDLPRAGLGVAGCKAVGCWEIGVLSRSGLVRLRLLSSLSRGWAPGKGQHARRDRQGSRRRMQGSSAGL